MDKDLFADLTASLKEAASIAKGQAFPSRSFKISGPDVKSVREQTGALSERVRVAPPSERQNPPELGTEPEATDRPCGSTDTDF